MTDAFTPDEQDEFLDLLLSGASIVGACRKLGREPDTFFRTCGREPEFRRRLDRYEELRQDNVLAKMYHAAMQGDVPAQKGCLDAYRRSAAPPDAQCLDDLFDRLTDDEFAQLQRALDAEAAVEPADSSGAAGVGTVPGEVS